MSKFYALLVCSLLLLFFVSTSYSQGNIKIKASGSTGMVIDGFTADRSYLLEIKAFNIYGICSLGGYYIYTYRIYVRVNTILVAGTGEFIISPYWYTWFPVNSGDYVEVTLVYETLPGCFGTPLGESLSVEDGVHLFGGWDPPYSPGSISQLENSTIPSEYNLEQNYPNPFNPSTTIKYSIPTDGFVKLAVYNLFGEEVATLVNNQQVAGSYEVDFDAGNLASGVYMYRLESGNYTESRKLMLVK